MFRITAQQPEELFVILDSDWTIFRSMTAQIPWKMLSLEDQQIRKYFVLISCTVYEDTPYRYGY